MKIELTQEIVREILDYDQETGILTWKERDVKWFEDGKHKAERRCNRWNSRHSHTEAFTGTNYYGYKISTIFGMQCISHRIIWLWMTGEFPNGEIDHINGNPSDNRWENLREVSRSGNMKNLKLSSSNTTGFKGVSFHKRDNLWCANINAPFDGRKKRLFLGYFKTPEEAYAAYCKAAEEFGYTKRHIYG